MKKEIVYKTEESHDDKYNKICLFYDDGSLKEVSYVAKDGSGTGMISRFEKGAEKGIDVSSEYVKEITSKYVKFDEEPGVGSK